MLSSPIAQTPVCPEQWALAAVEAEDGVEGDHVEEVHESRLLGGQHLGGLDGVPIQGHHRGPEGHGVDPGPGVHVVNDEGAVVRAGDQKLLGATQLRLERQAIHVIPVT